MNPMSNLPGMGFTGALDQIQGGGMTSAGPIVVNFTMPADAVNDAFNGRTVQVIASQQGQRASLAAAKASIGRTELAATLTQPMVKG